MTAAVRLWRIAADTPDYSADDTFGKGAERSGGRWNAKGTPLIYTSTSQALACLETMAHLDSGRSLPLNRYLVRFDVPQVAWAARTTFDPTRHVGWDALPPARVSVDWGTRWARDRASAIAGVPSVIVPDEFNMLINPAHPDASAIKATKLRRWSYDARAFGRRAK